MELALLAQRVANARQRVRESQIEFAKRLNVSQVTVSSIERGNLPRLELYARLVPILEQIEHSETPAQ